MKHAWVPGIGILAVAAWVILSAIVGWLCFAVYAIGRAMGWWG